MKFPLTSHQKLIAKIPLQKEQARLILSGLAPLVYPLIAIENGRLVIAVKSSPVKWCSHYILWFHCPICGRKNIHNKNVITKGSGDGERWSDCSCWSGIGYIIREVGQ